MFLCLGTSSLRRTAQIRRMYPHLTVCDIRGNLNTRLAKLDAADSKFSGIILAQAGLVRMGWMSRISQVLEPTDLLYAVGQGALAVECRANDNQVLTMLQKLMCLNTTCRILAERSFLKTLGGGCSAPVAVWSILKGEPLNGNSQEVGLSLTGAVWSLDGAIEIRNNLACALNEQKSEVEQRKRGAQESASQLQEENSSSCDSPPATKRARNGNDSSSGSDSNSSSPRQQGSPPVICEDVAACEALSGYTVDQDRREEPVHPRPGGCTAQRGRRLCGALAQGSAHRTADRNGYWSSPRARRCPGCAGAAGELQGPHDSLASQGQCDW